MSSRITGAHYSLFRALLGGYLVVHFLMLLPFASEVFAAGGSLADAALSPYFTQLPNPLWWDDGALMVHTLLIVGAAASLALLLGWGDRTAALLAALILSWLYQRNPLIANPSLPLLGWMLVLHAFVPPRPYGSLAGRMAGSDPQWRLSQHLWLAVWCILALSYSHSGWTKLASPSWIDGDSIRLVLENPLARDHLLREWLLATPPIVLKLLTWAVLWVELLFLPIALVPRLRPYIWLAMLIAQFGFFSFLNFADLTFPMLLAHLLTFDPRWLQRYECRTAATVLFDGDCAFCHGSVRLALHEDVSQRLQFAPLLGPTAQAKRGAMVLPAGGDSIVVIDDEGRPEFKSRAVAAVLHRLGGVWLFARWLLLAMPRPLADAGYDLVGRRRYRLGRRRSAGECPVIAGCAGRMLP